MENNRLQAPMAQMAPLLLRAIHSGGTAQLTVTGVSMLPLLKDRVSMVRLAAPQKLQKGDIVLFRMQQDHYVLHRIAAIHDGVYDIVGDNQRAADKNIPAADILAKVVAYSRDGTKWRKSDRLYRLCLPAIKTAMRCRRFAARQIKKLQ